MDKNPIGIFPPPKRLPVMKGVLFAVLVMIGGGCSEEPSARPKAPPPLSSASDDRSRASWKVFVEEDNLFVAAIIDEARASSHTRPGIALICDGSKSGEKRQMDIILAEWPPAPRPSTFSFQLTVDGKAIGKREDKHLGRQFYGNPLYSFKGDRAVQILETIFASPSPKIRVSNGHSFFEIGRADAPMRQTLRSAMARCR